MKVKRARSEWRGSCTNVNLGEKFVATYAELFDGTKSVWWVLSLAEVARWAARWPLEESKLRRGTTAPAAAAAV